MRLNAMSRSTRDARQVGVSTSLSELASALSWIHHDADSSELLALIRQISRDIAIGNPSRLRMAKDGQSIFAAAYFRILPGQVGVLGGTRALAGHEPTCWGLLNSLVTELESTGTRQIQAVIDEGDAASQSLLAHAGFSQYTSVQQFIVDVRLANRSVYNDRVTWVSAAHRSRQEVAQLIESTFIDTLDCPALNNVRTPQDVLSGFLEGGELSDVQDWYILHREGHDIGCVFTTQHSADVVELIYMGLHPNSRGRRLGTTLVCKAIDLAKTLGAKILVAGVDRDNQPALQIYRDLSFQMVRTLPVFFRNADIQQMRRAA